MPNTRGHKVIIRSKSLIAGIKRTLRGTGVEPEDAIEAMAPLILAACEHATSSRAAQDKGAPAGIRGAAVLKEIYLISSELSDKIKPKGIEEDASK